MGRDKKLIYFLVTLIILLAIILLIKIKMASKYDPILYANIYDEYENIFGKEDNEQKNKENDIIQSINKNNNVAETSNTHQAVVDATSNNNEQGNVIGKIVIPKIDISYPIIKETTTEYLKIAPTKYCGPNVNEVRKFSYSRA